MPICTKLNVYGRWTLIAEDYDVDLLISELTHSRTYNLDVYIEPGEAVALSG